MVLRTSSDVVRRAALRDHVGRVVDEVDVIAVAADHAVRARAAVQLVVAVVADQGVVADPAGQIIGAGIAGDLVGETRCRCRRCRRCRSRVRFSMKSASVRSAELFT